ncbi:MAG: 50S ribosomal protein L35 [Pseudomonadota bacterium]|nr:50S ribosomal protein L35 [Pseudomonadota bacterium]
MAKMKTIKGASKRFKVSKSGRIKRRAANRNHILTKKAKGRKRRLRVAVNSVSSCEKSMVLRMLKQK